MKQSWKVLSLIFLLVLGLSLLNPSLAGTTGTAAAAEKTTIFIAGDSTACNYEAARAPRTGWGQVLKTFFNDNVAVQNEAVSGRSSKSFIDEGYLAKILNQIKANDYLLIQFGHNDEKKNDATRYTEPFTTYKSYLTQYINGARAKGAIPVLLTPVNRYKFDANGKVVPTHGDYPKAVLQLGAKLKVPVIDITEKSRILFESLGPEKTFKLFMNLNPGESPNYPNGNKDNTHFTREGATAIAKLVVDGIRENNLPLAKYILPRK